MKKLALAIASLALAATPVLACPGHDATTDQEQQTPKTAEKAKDQKAQPKQDAKPAPKQDTAKQADKAKPAPAKPAPKVSSK